MDFVFKRFEIMHGGELFVPKMPSVRLQSWQGLWLLSARQFVYKTGRKTYEAMISEDDARNTLEFKDSYIVAKFMVG